MTKNEKKILAAYFLACVCAGVIDGFICNTMKNMCLRAMED